MKIDDTLTKMGFAWIEDDTGELNWVYAEDFKDVDPKDRPKDCTPVVIEISPTNDWVEKKRREHEFLGDLQEQMNKFSSDLFKLEQNLKLKGKS